jgi:ABC-type multidrug transport system permease subunit
MMGGMRPGIIILREGTDTSQVRSNDRSIDSIDQTLTFRYDPYLYLIRSFILSCPLAFLIIIIVVVVVMITVMSNRGRLNLLVTSMRVRRWRMLSGPR